MTRRLPGDTPSRRRFLQVVSLTAVASAVNSSAMSWAQGRSSAPAGTAKSGSAPAAPSDSAKAAAAPPPISDEAKALASIVKMRYGKHLDPDQLEAVTRQIDGRVQDGIKLRKAKLVNSDEPDVVFHAG